MEASAPKVDYDPEVDTPKPRWIIRDKNGYAPGINILRLVGLFRWLVPPGILTALEFKKYRKIALLNGVQGTPARSTPRRSTTSRATSRAHTPSR